MSTVPEVTLNNGVRIPQLGFGVWQVDSGDVVDVVRTAIETGYRSIDTAAAYGNEEGVGEAIRRSGVPREEIFVTSKLWNTDQGYDSTLRAFDATVRRLGLEVLDLYLIHWPMPARDTYVDSWKAMERLYAEGRVRAIGVSNFHADHLTRVLQEGGIVPTVNQIELHPRLTQERLREFDRQHDIATEAWSPLGQGNVLSDPTIGKIAEAYGKTPAQVILRWHLQIGNIVIPKSVTPERIRSNFDVFDFQLSSGDVDTISGLNTGERFGPDPDTLNS
ncbi:aldo/keto reductase [Streptomonospora nanhaiensis]|uniref:Diketogulonate reductase-like aldo/keto reductase n=1 Tax=Streptomonospora nanhaiensis TaxID=1323731 RepID=A0A853BI03_9ACTN|nr:aldo/keto reductase [Streptomonospora nanhaiensis]MBV2364659.1 aldo/keto reductase [Streptomonospora nanhaiensis]MBX9390134.1 aldo/keto reductase [Streptomonospora nanhaiensis]NYI94650.1 diketogulonate reductase-like aldo/keto reductase [Streptomonospora nanhaiensis]